MRGMCEVWKGTERDVGQTSDDIEALPTHLLPGSPPRQIRNPLDYWLLLFCKLHPQVESEVL